MSVNLTPPVILEGETAESLYGRVEAEMQESGFALRQGTPEAAIARSLAFLVYDELWVNATRIWYDMWIESALGDRLDRHGQHYATPRLDATKATVELTFEGVDGTVIDAGTVITTAAQVGIPAVSFETTASATIVSGVATVEAEALVAAARGNVLAGAIRFLANPIAGIENIYNEDDAVGGSDVEPDGRRYTREDYRGRLLERAGQDEGMANIDDYEAILDTIPGVGFRLVEPHWNGYGTIRIVILDEDGEIPSDELVDLVQEILDPLADPGEGEGQGSIAHTITVVAPTEVSLAIDVPDLEAEAGYTLEQAQANLEAAAHQYVLTVNPGGLVVIRDLEAVMIQAAGVANIGDITISVEGGPQERADVPLVITEKAVIAEFLYDGVGGS